MATVNRLIRDFRFPTVPGGGAFQDKRGAGQQSPDVSTIPLQHLDNFDLSVGFAWNILSVDIVIWARILDIDNGLQSSKPDGVAARIYAGQLPIGETVLSYIGLSPLGTDCFIWRSIINLPQPIQLVTTDQPVQVEISGSNNTVAVPVGHHFTLSQYLGFSAMTFYGSSERIS